MNRAFCIGLAGLLVVAALGLAAPASADNSNSNTNNNDVTQPSSLGGDGDTSASESTTWPPTDQSWPPKDVLNGGVDNGRGGSGNSESTPIVMPLGQPAPTSTATATPSATAKPIVPVNTP
jgi:hypothetical protein